MPTDRYRLYHVEKAKGGIGDDDDGGIGGGRRGQPAGVRQPPRLRRRHRPVDPADDRRGPRARRGVHDPAHPPRPAHRMGAGRLAAGARPVAAARAGPPGGAQGGRGLGHRPHRRQVRRRRRADAGRRHGRHRDRVLRAPVRPVLVAADQPAHRRVRRVDREPPALRLARAHRRSASASAPDFIVGIRMAVDETVPGGIDAPTGLEIARPAGGRRARRLRQRDPRLHRRRARR